MRGLKFFNKDNAVVMRAGEFTATMTEIPLEVGEKLLQIKTKHINDSINPF